MIGLTYSLQRYARLIETILDPRFPKLRRHLHLFEAVGIAGLSSDEEDVEYRRATGRRRYISHRKHYISEDVSSLGYRIEEIGHQYIRPKAYHRIPGPPAGADEWVAELPCNGYDQRWYISLTGFERDILNAQGMHSFVDED